MDRPSMKLKKAISIATLVLSGFYGAFAQETKIVLEEPAGLDRAAWPVGIGLPFPRGEMKDADSFFLYSPQGLPIPLQTRSLDRWPDGSIRWTYLQFQADMQRQKTENWILKWKESKTANRPKTRIIATATRGKIVVDTGAIQVTFSGDGRSLFDSVKIGDREMLRPDAPCGFMLARPDGRVYFSHGQGKVKLEMEESGPIRAVIRMEGEHRSKSGQPLFDYVCRFFFYAGKSWFETEYGFINREMEESTDLASIKLSIPLSTSASGYRGTTSEYKIDKFYELREPFSIYSGPDDFFGVFGGARIFRNDGTEMLGMGYESEVRARWWADTSDARGGLTVSVREMSQNYPKAIQSSPGRIDIELYPARETKALSFHQGWQKTQTVLFYFHRSGAREAGSRELCFQWQAPVIPWSPYPVQSGSLGDIFPYSPAKYPMIERALREGFVAYESGVGRGMIDYGDTIGPGAGERGNFMQNNAYDTSWVSYLLFLRTGERRYWQRARAAAQHTADIDVVHHSTRNRTEIGGVRIHGPNHVQYNAEAILGSSVAPNHEWVEGLLMTYHLTGEKRYLDLSRGLADHILKAIDAGWILPPYNARWNGARNLAWPLLILAVMYDETGNQAYREGARKIVDGFASIQMENGSFPIAIGPYEASAPLHNAIAMEALGRYHSLTGDAKAREIFMRCIDSTLRDLTFPDGEFMYINHPDYRSGYVSMPWGGFHFGYVFTGNKKYLLFPYPLIMRQLKSHGFGTSGEGALSYSLRGILFYLQQADKAGILRDLPEY